MQQHVTRLTRERVRPEDPRAVEILAGLLRREMSSLGRKGTGATIVCIGTDRSTGDALGPLVGTLLEQQPPSVAVSVFGTLRLPVHAGNLSELQPDLRLAAASGPVLAVDACLGSFESVGSVQVHHGPLRPSAGVRKELPPVGDIAVMATVNVGGFMEYVVLQNTRLGLVYEMAAMIAGALRLCFNSAAQPAGAVQPPGL